MEKTLISLSNNLEYNNFNLLGISNFFILFTIILSITILFIIIFFNIKHSYKEKNIIKEKTKHIYNDVYNINKINFKSNFEDILYEYIFNIEENLSFFENGVNKYNKKELLVIEFHFEKLLKSIDTYYIKLDYVNKYKYIKDNKEAIIEEIEKHIKEINSKIKIIKNKNIKIDELSYPDLNDFENIIKEMHEHYENKIFDDLKNSIDSFRTSKNKLTKIIKILSRKISDIYISEMNINDSERIINDILQKVTNFSNKKHQFFNNDILIEYKYVNKKIIEEYKNWKINTNDDNVIIRNEKLSRIVIKGEKFINNYINKIKNKRHI